MIGSFNGVLVGRDLRFGAARSWADSSCHLRNGDEGESGGGGWAGRGSGWRGGGLGGVGGGAGGGGAGVCGGGGDPVYHRLYLGVLCDDGVRVGRERGAGGGGGIGGRDRGGGGGVMLHPGGANRGGRDDYCD